MAYTNTEQALKPVRLIIPAMIMGAGLFGVLTVFLILGKIVETRPDMANLLLATLGGLVVMEIPAYVIVRNVALGKLQQQYQGRTPDDAIGVELAKGFVQITLIGAAMAEGISLFGLVILLITGNWLALIAPVLGLLVIAMQFPTRDKFGRFASDITGQHWG